MAKQSSNEPKQTKKLGITRIKERSNDYIFLTVITVYTMLAIGTFFHDPILHQIPAVLFGWELGGYQNGIMIGSTTAIANAGASPLSLWIFYMFPAIAVFFTVVIVTILRQDRLVFVGGIILISLNIASLNPEIKGSDACNAAQMLITNGWSELWAYLLHFVIFILFLLLWGLYLYVVIESNPKDAVARARNIIH